MLGRKGKRVAALAAFAVAGSSLLALPAAHAAATPIVIWVDDTRQVAVQTAIGSTYQGHPVQVVVNKDIKGNIATVAAADAPDVIVGAHDWTGGLVANGSIVKLFPTKAQLSLLSADAVSAFRYGNGLWGMPYAVENVAVIVNNALIKKNPTTFAQLEATGLAAKKKLLAAGKKDALALAVQQGANGDAYHMYPLFSGLGGYVFGSNGHGGLDQYNVGVANKKFLKNAPLIAKWNKEGLIRSSVDGGIAQNSFSAGHAAYWITGPWQNTKNAQGHSTLGDLKFKYSIIALPTIVKGITPRPFSGVQGFYVTKFAKTHGVDLAAKSLVTSLLTSQTVQTKLANSGGRAPANLKAAAKVSDKNVRAFSLASKFSVPMPNIPAMGVVWGPLATAWVQSTKGSGAVAPATAFKKALSTINKQIN